MNGLVLFRSLSVCVLVLCILVAATTAHSTQQQDENPTLLDIRQYQVRALRGWGLVPDGFDDLVLRLNKEGIHLLNADIYQLQSLLDTAASELTLQHEDIDLIHQLIQKLKLLQGETPLEPEFTVPEEQLFPAVEFVLSSSVTQIEHLVDLSGFGTLIVEVDVEPALNVRIDLFDQADGSLLAWDASGHTLQRRVERVDLAAGTYAVQIRRTSGEGQVIVKPRWLQISVPYDLENNDEIERAQIVEADVRVSGVLGYRNAGYLDSLDWYRLQTSTFGQLDVAVEMEPSLNARLDFHDGKGTLLSWDASGNASERRVIRADLAPGDYQIRLQRTSGQGAYLMTPHFTPTAYVPDPEQNDTKEQAVELQLGQSQSGLLGYLHEQLLDTMDWYCLQQPDYGVLNVSAALQPTLNVRLDLYDGLGNLLGWDASGHPPAREVSRLDLAPGPYCIRLQRVAGYGGYVLETDLVVNQHAVDKEPNDTPAEAQVLTRDNPLTGLLGYVKQNQLDSIDWFQFELSQDAAIHLTSVSEPTLNLRLDLYAEEGTRNIAWDASGQTTERSIQHTELGAGNYYVRLQRVNGHGGYTLLLRLNNDD